MNMRKVFKDFSKIPSPLFHCSQSKEQDLIETKKVDDNCYKKARAGLEKLYANKCAYCETRYLATSDTWVEHYRPKSIYYWLAYEWSNLIPTCAKCNRKKNNNFPLINEVNKVKFPPLKEAKLNLELCKADCAPLLNETPFMLHPEMDDPIEFLDFKLDENNTGIELIGKDVKARGQRTIEICDLNRDDLRLDRQEKVIDDLPEDIDFLFSNLENGVLSMSNFFPLFEMVCKKLVSKSKNEFLEHTLLRKTILIPQKFQEVVGPYIKNLHQRTIVIAAFEKYFN